jgi:hypothetical protein
VDHEGRDLIREVLERLDRIEAEVREISEALRAFQGAAEALRDGGVAGLLASLRGGR